MPVRLSRLRHAPSKVKKLHLDRALAYANKLLAEGQIDDDTYHLMYRTLNNLLQKNSRSGYIK